MDRTGHRSIDGIRAYKRISQDQEKKVSSVLNKEYERKVALVEDKENSYEPPPSKKRHGRIFANKNTQSRDYKMSLIRWLSSSAQLATLPEEGEPSGTTEKWKRLWKLIRKGKEVAIITKER
uniref:Uncharacterized protein n=1 Tax=Amphimedon queenslandica TaxID=400682 RepID=A0A1X7TAD7_AMPQE